MKKETKIERMTRYLNRMSEMGFSYEEAQSLRRIEMTLQRWAERECGDGSNWAIERDETTGKPFNVYHGPLSASRPEIGKQRRYAIADREAGALKRVERIMARHPDYVAYHQTDCRGCMLYIVAKADLKDGAKLEQVYTRGVAVCI